MPTVLDGVEAVRKRRSVRTYTDKPVSEADVDLLLRLGLLAPTGHMAQAWGFIVVREPDIRRELAELVIRGGAMYFRDFRPRADGVDEEAHARAAEEYAEQALGTYREVPIWLCAVIVPRFSFPDQPVKEHVERFSDITSVAFALENIFVAARALGIGTVPTNFHFLVEDEYRRLLGIPDEIGVHYITPLGYPPQFPQGLPPAMAKVRRPWRTLVHDDCWGSARAERA
jgi:nitroreductase